MIFNTLNRFFFPSVGAPSFPDVLIQLKFAGKTYGEVRRSIGGGIVCGVMKKVILEEVGWRKRGDEQ